MARDHAKATPPPYAVDDPDTWGASVQEGLAWSLRRARSGRGWSTARLSDECSEVGYPVSRGTIAKVESGERTTLTVVEWLALAYALGVPPTSLLVPWGTFLERRVVPGAEPAPALAVDAWFAAQAPLRTAPDDRAAWDRAAAPLAALRDHERLVSDYRKSRTSIQGIDGGPWSDLSPARLDLVEFQRRQFESDLAVAAYRLMRLRRRFTDEGWPLPPLPREVAETIDAEPWEGMVIADA